jgi:hypothetical protein
MGSRLRERAGRRVKGDSYAIPAIWAKAASGVSEAALGPMTFGDDWGWGAAKEEAQKVYETYRQARGN